MKVAPITLAVSLVSFGFVLPVEAKHNIEYETQELKTASLSCDLIKLKSYLDNDSKVIRMIAKDHIHSCSKSELKVSSEPKIQAQAVNGDTTAPSFEAFSYSISSINVDSGSVAVDVSLTLKDTESEIDSASVTLYPPEGIPSSHGRDIYFSSDDWAAGTEANTYVAKETLIFDNTDAGGRWYAEVERREDTSGNVEYDNVTAEDIISAGSNPYLNIVNSSVVDITPPSFYSIDANVRELDVSTGTKEVDITLTLLDEGSNINSASIRLYPPEGSPDSHYKYASMYSSSWTAGDVANTYKATATITFDETDVAGQWSLAVTSRSDDNNNYTYDNVTTEQIVTAGSDPYITLVNSNEVDVTPPTFHSFSYGTSSIDIASGEVSVDVTLTLYDAASEVTSASLFITSPTNIYDWKSVYFGSSDWKAGEEANTYIATSKVVFETTDTIGQWYAYIGWMSDSNDNDQFENVTAEDIVAAGFNPYLTVSKTDGGSTLSDCASTIAATECSIDIGQNYIADMDFAGDRDVYKVSVVESGMLSMSTEGGLDMFGVFYDGEGNFISFDNDSGGDDNFSLSSSVEPGDYYLLVREYDKAMGSYTLKSEFEAVKECASTAAATDCSIGLGESVEAKMEAAGDRDVYEIVIAESGMLTLSTTGGLDTFGVLYDNTGSYIAFDNDSGSDNNFSLTQSVEPGSYHILVREYQKALGDYVLNAEFSAVKDCAATQAETDCTIAIGETVEAKMEVAGDRDVYALTITSSGTLVLSSSGELDMFGVLYDDTGTYVAFDNDSGSGSNFSVSYDVEPGTYYILAREYQRAVGDYSLTVGFNQN